MHRALEGIDPNHVGVAYDIRHATVEAGMSWPVTFRMIQPHIQAVYVKDFVWARGDDGWTRKWVNLGEGMVEPKYFDMLLASGYRDPIIQHHEYDHGQGDVLVEHCRKDLAALRAMLG